jgi:hypothetical protein
VPSRGTLATFEDPLLSECATAFERRGKAIRYHTKSLAIERAVEADGRERLTVEIRPSGGGRPASVHLSLWPDGSLWFQAARPGVRARGGWDFLFSFTGTLGDLHPDELVSTFESSLPEVSGLRPATDAEARVLSLWSRVQPIAG